MNLIFLVCPSKIIIPIYIYSNIEVFVVNLLTTLYYNSRG